MNLEDIIVLDDDDQTVGIIMKKYSLDLHDAIKKKLLDKKDRKRIARKLLEASLCLTHQRCDTSRHQTRELYYWMRITTQFSQTTRFR